MKTKNKLKIIFNQDKLITALKKLRKGEEILLYEKPIKDIEDFRRFQSYLSNLIILKRYSGLEIKGGLIFSKQKQTSEVTK